MNEIDMINLKIKSLEDKKKIMKKSLNNDIRKERTRRLIQTGALAEKYFDIEHLTIEERESVFQMFSEFIKSNLPSKYKQK